MAAAGCVVDVQCAAMCIEAFQQTACAEQIFSVLTCLAGQMTMNCFEDLEVEGIEDFPYCTAELLAAAQCFEREGASWGTIVDDNWEEDGGDPCSIEQGCQCSSACATCICAAGEDACVEVCAESD
jgi:hypothetical protein